jgi:hypothetical protein
MDVSPNVLRKETVQTLKRVENGLSTISDDSIMATLLLAKAQCLNTLVLLQEKKK